jgi:hypothetical protein
MGHGTPLRPSGAGEDACGHAGPFLLDAGVSSTYVMARSWGLTKRRITAIDTAVDEAAEEETVREPAWWGASSGRKADIASTIRKALAAAGLMKR